MESVESKQINVVKFTLGTGKVVLMREPLISDTETAAQIAGKIAGPENQLLIGMLLQKEMLKLLLVSVDGKKLSMTEKMQLDKHFKIGEYNQCMKAIKMLMGEEGNDQLTPEFETTGA